MRLNDSICNVLLLIFTSIFMIFLLEVSLRSYFLYFGTPHPTRWEFRATQPLPYKDAEYFSQDFLQESMESLRGDFFNTHWVEDVQGDFFNHKDGIRITTDIPENHERRVLLFGGSTMYSQEVPDHETIASYLQRTLNETSSIAYQVINYGIPSFTVLQQLEKLKKLQLEDGDLVIFYDGVNNARYPILFGFTEPGDEGYQPVKKLSPLAKYFQILYMKYPNLGIAKLLHRNALQEKPVTLMEDELHQSAFLASVAEYSSLLEEADKLVSAKGGAFAHFLQPCIFTTATNSLFEQELIQNPLLVPPGVKEAIHQAYPLFRNALADLSFLSVDISGVLDERTSEVFLDDVHINHEGNRFVGTRIARELLERGLLS